jgi:ABC-type uncharacterized transport system fused permease/ATPase subunit
VSIAQSIASAVLAPSLHNIAEALAISWRTRMTSILSEKYLHGNTAYLTSQLSGLGDADQRLTKDLDRLSRDLAALIPSVIKPIFMMSWFSARLWRLSGQRGMLVRPASLRMYAKGAFQNFARRERPQCMNS